jgi:IS1 family transposase
LLGKHQNNHFQLFTYICDRFNKEFMVMVIKEGSDRNTILKLWERLKKSNKGFSAKSYCGVIKLKSHPLEIQKKLRDEWK